MKNILALVFATAAIAPPPFAAPSSFVIIIPPIELTSVNAFDCASAVSYTHLTLPTPTYV